MTVCSVLTALLQQEQKDPGYLSANCYLPLRVLTHLDFVVAVAAAAAIFALGSVSMAQ